MADVVDKLRKLALSLKDVEEKVACKGTAIRAGAQDCYWESSGAFTGEVSPAMILDAGCAFTLVGHSERREYFGETNETANQKVKAALEGQIEALRIAREARHAERRQKVQGFITDLADRFFD